jgi:hypothetical protein
MGVQKISKARLGETQNSTIQTRAGTTLTFGLVPPIMFVP